MRRRTRTFRTVDRPLNGSEPPTVASLGVRVRLGSAVVTRIDFAHSSEGFRWMWTFSDVYFTPRW